MIELCQTCSATGESNSIRSLSSNEMIALHMKSFITAESKWRRDCGTACVCVCVSRTADDVITNVMTLIGDFDTLCQGVGKGEKKKKKKYFTSRVVSIATPHIILRPEQTIPPANKSTWRGRETGTWQVLLCWSFRLVQVVIWFSSRTRIKNRVFCYVTWYLVAQRH